MQTLLYNEKNAYDSVQFSLKDENKFYTSGSDKGNSLIVYKIDNS